MNNVAIRVTNINIIVDGSTVKVSINHVVVWLKKAVAFSKTVFRTSCKMLRAS